MVTNSFATYSPVLLFLSKQDQADTLGFNIVDELPNLVYKEIMSGRVSLWDSPNKDLQIKPSSLKSLEESSGDDFSNSKQLFIYELWDLDRKKGDLKTVGFYFSSRTTKGDEISYGFVAFESLDSLFRQTRISSNANGNCELTFDQVLKSHYYFFNVVQVGEKKITNIKEALALKDEVKIFLSQKTVPPSSDCKDIVYLVEPIPGDSNTYKENSNNLIQKLQLYLNENKEVFYNLGGDRIKNFIQLQKVTITSIEIQEKWVKFPDKIQNELVSIKIFAENQALDLIAKSDIHILDMLIDFKSLGDFLNEKEFYFRIGKINDQEITEAQSVAYLKGLRSWKWNQLTEFVRYE
ncbi:MAG TPA: hypothetical protein PKJ62_02000 [Bacteroidia bacterium]|nr:hypothetical protein [Bacteroidia bacterium]HNS11210.1 hypothetical protein [Bacteroidia bacterium]